jgi:hypothetical protein
MSIPLICTEVKSQLAAASASRTAIRPTSLGSIRDAVAG